VQLGTKLGGEHTLLALAAQIEQARPWRDHYRRLSAAPSIRAVGSAS
jgi:hypothetical protein